MAKHRKSRKGVTMPRSKASATAVTRKVTAGALALLIGAGVVPSVLAPAVSAAPTGQGFTLNAGDMRFILKQIKIAENNATKEDAQGNDVPGQPLLGNGPNQIASPLLPYGLRTVDGTDNNLVAGQSGYGSASREFPRLSDPEWRTSSGGQSYESVNANVTDNGPRFVSNVIVDQTATNPAAVAAAGQAHRTVNDGPTAVPCDGNGLPENCVPEGRPWTFPTSPRTLVFPRRTTACSRCSASSSTTAWTSLRRPRTTS